MKAHFPLFQSNMQFNLEAESGSTASRFMCETVHALRVSHCGYNIFQGPQLAPFLSAYSLAVALSVTYFMYFINA